MHVAAICRPASWALRLVPGWLAAFGCAAGALAGDPPGLASTALPARPANTAPTMMVVVPSAESGLTVDNKYDDPRMWKELYPEFEDGSIGTGVCIGDFDGDGRPDIYIVTKTHGCRLYRNLGNYKFEDVTERAGVGAEAGVWNEGATFVDINNSGRLDLYVCRQNAPNLLYINQGNGTFKEMGHAYGLDVKDASVMAAFCDYDRDGWLDLYLTTNLLDHNSHPNGQRGYLFHNNRNGTFTNVTEAAGISGENQSHSATWWDYDNDGWPDLYVANDYGYPDKLYHNNRDGTFTEVIDQVMAHTSFYSMGADYGDVNNDGRVDLLVADMAMSSHFRDQNAIAESRNRDPVIDDYTKAWKAHRSALYLNTGTAKVQEAAYLAGVAATDWTWSVRFEDLDNDGWLDLFVTNGFNRDPNPDVDRLGMDSISSAERIKALYDAPVLAEDHFAFRNRGNLEFEDTSAAWGLKQRGVAFGTAFGDLGGTGNLDLIYTNYEAPATLMRNLCDKGHIANVYLRGTISNRFGIGATVTVESALGTQVRPLMLARGYLSSSEPIIHFGLGADTEIRRLTVTWPSGVVQTFEHLPVDRRYTVTEPAGRPILPPIPAPSQYKEMAATCGLNIARKEETVDEVYAQRLLPERLNRRGPAAAVGDIFGNGRDDVVIGGTTMQPLQLFRAEPDGRFVPIDASALGTRPADDGPVLLFAASGQGHADLLITVGGNTLAADSADYQPELFLNDGRGGFRPAPPGTLPPLPINAGAVAAADFDHSGRLGVFIGGRVRTGDYPAAPHSALLANRGGRFEDVTDALAPGLRTVGMVTGAVWSDVDGDGWPDLILTLEWGGVRYFHNRQGRGFDDCSAQAGFAAAGNGWWSSIAAADFNGDGRPDFVVGNVGLNTPYHADPAHPAVLYAGDFRGNGRTELLEAYYEDGKLYPRRSRRGLAAALPFVLKRFPKNSYYAQATLGQIVGDDKLARAQRYTATELRSGVFLSQPDGTYRFAPLPRIAQIAPFDGVVAGDFGGRGHADIYALENSYAPIPSVGRYDGGLSQLLRGDGHGNFMATPPIESGLIVSGDAKALVLLALGSPARPGFLATRNNAPTLAFEPAAPPTRSFRIRLAGPPGNPTAVGARIELDFDDGSKEVAEVQAGSSYYSQSTSAVYFGTPPGRTPHRARIRWPDGSVTTPRLPPGEPEIVLAPTSP